MQCKWFMGVWVCDFRSKMSLTVRDLLLFSADIQDTDYAAHTRLFTWSIPHSRRSHIFAVSLEKLFKTVFHYTDLSANIMKALTVVLWFMLYLRVCTCINLNVWQEPQFSASAAFYNRTSWKAEVGFNLQTLIMSVVQPLKDFRLINNGKNLLLQ